MPYRTTRPLLLLAVTALAVTAVSGCSFRGAVTVGAPGPASPLTSTPASVTPTSPALTSPALTSSAPTSPVPASTGGAVPPAGDPQPCAAGQLTAALTPAVAPPDQDSAVLTLTNTGRSTCHLRGFGGIALNRSDGVPVLSRQVRADVEPQTVVLAQGRSARSTLTWSAVPNTDRGEPATGGCEPVPTSLLVIPPDQVEEQAVPWQNGPVCDQGNITQTPYTSA